MRILVVDDSSDAAEMLAELLRELGYDIAIALDGTTALSTFITFQPHVAILGRFRATPLIAYSAYSTTSFHERGVEAGFDHYLVKPNALEELMALLDQYNAQLA